LEYEEPNDLVVINELFGWDNSRAIYRLVPITERTMGSAPKSRIEARVRMLMANGIVVHTPDVLTQSIAIDLGRVAVPDGESGYGMWCGSVRLSVNRGRDVLVLHPDRLDDSELKAYRSTCLSELLREAQ
jgi:hypothetical protein